MSDDGNGDCETMMRHIPWWPEPENCSSRNSLPAFMRESIL